MQHLTKRSNTAFLDSQRSSVASRVAQVSPDIDQEVLWREKQRFGTVTGGFRKKVGQSVDAPKIVVLDYD